MMPMKHKCLFVFLLLGLTACGQRPAVEATVLRFTDIEPQREPTPVRMIITPDFLRIDDGTDGKTFVLYARKERVVYNVSAEDQLVLVIAAGPAPAKPPMKLVHTVEAQKESPPSVGGHPVRRYYLKTNDRLCYDVYAAANLLPGAQGALREFIIALATDQTQSSPMMPRELLTPCYLANNIYAPARYLDHGFPIRRSEPGGRVSELNDYKQSVRVDPALFVLPTDFRRMNIHELRAR